MINRKSAAVDVISYTVGLDEYGQKRQLGETKRTIKMMIQLFSQKNTDDPRYVAVDTIGLTKDLGITDANVIEYNNIKYQVLYVIPSSRYNQILMRQIQ